MRFVWRAFAYSVPRQAPFIGLHLVDVNTMSPRCPNTFGELQPALARPSGYVPTCVECLELAEWEINNAAMYDMRGTARSDQPSRGAARAPRTRKARRPQVR